MTEEQEQPIPIEDSTPTLSEQCKARGWDFGFYNFGKGEVSGTYYLNPGLVERPDGLWLLVRRSEPHPQGFKFGQNSVWAFQLDATGKIPKRGKKLEWGQPNENQHFEDARAFYHPVLNQTVVSACTFVWEETGEWTGSHIIVGAFGAELNADNERFEALDWINLWSHYPKIGGNPGQMEKITDHKNFQKNWAIFLHENKLHILYKSKPWMIAAFGETWEDVQPYQNEEGSTWNYGQVRGGTPPVKVGDYYFTFHHSSLPWRGRYRRYYAGCTAFDAKPPFRPRLITPEPIFAGSQNDQWEQRRPVCVFPCGAIIRDGLWHVTMGVNDIRSAWASFTHESLLKLMQPISGTVTPVFSQNGLSEAEQRKERQREQARKAREAKALKAQQRKEGAFPALSVRKLKRYRKRRKVVA